MDKSQEQKTINIFSIIIKTIDNLVLACKNKNTVDTKNEIKTPLKNVERTDTIKL